LHAQAVRLVCGTTLCEPIRGGIDTSWPSELLATLQARVLKGTKFSKMFRYRCADFLYLVVEENIFAEAEIPAGWGLLVRRGDELVLARAPVALDAADAQRIALLENIALAATRAGVRDLDEEESPA
jgi:hypothetical protein